MAIGFDEALKVARECATKRTGDENPVVLRFEHHDNFFFQFNTSKGYLNIIVDPYGEVGQCFEEASPEETEAPLSRHEAVIKAIKFFGEGKISYIKAKNGGFEVEVDRGSKGPSVVFVDREGMVHRQKCTVLTRNPELDV